MNEQKLEKQRRNLVDRGLLSPDEKLYGSITINYTEKLAGRIETWKRGGRSFSPRDFHANTSIFLTAVLRNWENAIRDFFR